MRSRDVKSRPSSIELRARDLVRTAQAQFVDESAFRFRHILVRETAYNGTTKALRAELHERFADWLAEKVGARVAEFEEILGYHLEQAHRYISELGELGAERAALGSAQGGTLRTRAFAPSTAGTWQQRSTS